MNTGLIYIRRATDLFSLTRLKNCSKRVFRQIRSHRSLFTREPAVTADAIELAVKKGIDIVYLDRMGRPFARTYSCEQENSATVQRYQARAYDDGKGVLLISSMIGAKIRNQAYLLKSFARNRGSEPLNGEAERIMSLSEKIGELAEEWGSVEEARDSLFGIEGEASRVYFQALSGEIRLTQSRVSISTLKSRSLTFMPVLDFLLFLLILFKFDGISILAFKSTVA